MEERRRFFRALVVEDDAAVCELIRVVLEREGFEVDCLRNGASAIEVLKSAAYELMIVDLMMPLVNGMDVLQFIIETQPQSLQRVIVTTASPRLLESEFMDRICRLLEKPFDVDRLALFARECATGAIEAA